jgi:hypothetical protein
MTTFDVTSTIRLGRQLDGDFDTATVKAEPMFFRARGDFAWANGGPITRSFLSALGRPFDTVVVDSRVHMLMKGWYPCVPGWHHDDVPRLRDDGQPWYPEVDGEHDQLYRPKHALALVGDDVCRTQFAVGRSTVPAVSEGNVYGVWHPIVAEAIAAGQLATADAPLGRVVEFDDRSWHQGTPATGRGWRWFGRASWDTATVKAPENEVRPQVQVYLPTPMEGW